jgi:signal transduction protein with GAF and PtsI domain
MAGAIVSAMKQMVSKASFKRESGGRRTLKDATPSKRSGVSASEGIFVGHSCLPGNINVQVFYSSTVDCNFNK